MWFFGKRIKIKNYLLLKNAQAQAQSLYAKV